MACDCANTALKDATQKSVLRTLLLVNAALFVAEIGVGIAAHSAGVIADALDMLADALVFGLALAAVGRSEFNKVRAARLAGWFQLGLAGIVLGDIVRRSLGGGEPESLWMFSISCVALAANLYCLFLISKEREGEVHMRASWIFAKTDVLANLGVIVASGLVYATDSKWPDLIVGAMIVCVVLRGGLQILREAGTEQGRSLCGSRREEALAEP